jgi:replicative DNA helicase
MKQYFYEVPDHVSVTEAAALYEYMATGKTKKTEYLKEKNQVIYNQIENLNQKNGRIGTQQLINHLTEYNLLDNCGGLSYIQKVFNGLEPEELII